MTMLTKWLQILILSCFITSLNASGQEAEFVSKLKQIVPLQTTEREVEKLYGKPSKRYADIAEYKTKEGELTVRFSDGKCDSISEDEYQIEAGLVVDAILTLDDLVRIEKLNVDLSKLKRTPDGLNTIYEDAEKGMKLGMYNNIVNNIYLNPLKQYSDLLCIS